MHRILIWPDIRPIILPDTGYPAGYLAWPDTGYPAKNKINSIIKKNYFFFLNFSPFCLFQFFFCFFKFSQFFRLKQYSWHCSQYLQFRLWRYRISGFRQMKPDIRPDTGYQKVRISGATLQITFGPWNVGKNNVY